jgi:hypothetical protein
MISLIRHPVTTVHKRAVEEAKYEMKKYKMEKMEINTLIQNLKQKYLSIWTAATIVSAMGTVTLVAFRTVNPLWGVTSTVFCLYWRTIYQKALLIVYKIETPSPTISVPSDPLADLDHKDDISQSPIPPPIPVHPNRFALLEDLDEEDDVLQENADRTPSFSSLPQNKASSSQTLSSSYVVIGGTGNTSDVLPTSKPPIKTHTNPFAALLVDSDNESSDTEQV